MGVTTAGQSYLAMLSDVVVPVLGEFGFARSGEVFCIDRDDAWARLGFEASRPDARSVTFTINACVVSKGDWCAARVRRAELPEQPSPHCPEPEVPGWWCGVGQLLYGHDRHGWRLCDGQDPGAVSRGVASVLREYMVPTMIGRLER